MVARINHFQAIKEKLCGVFVYQQEGWDGGLSFPETGVRLVGEDVDNTSFRLLIPTYLEWPLQRTSIRLMGLGITSGPKSVS